MNENQPYDVVLGKIEDANEIENLSGKLKIIEEYIKKQLAKNKQFRNDDFGYCTILDNLCTKYKIPFTYTQEGIDMITASNIAFDEENEGEKIKYNFFERTYGISDKDDFLNLFPISENADMSLVESEVALRKAVKDKTIKNRMVRNVLKRLQTKEGRKEFLTAVSISDLKFHRTNKLKQICRNKVIDYMIKSYENESLEAKQPKMTFEQYRDINKFLKANNIDRTLDISAIAGGEKNWADVEAVRYYNFKENGLAIDVKRILETTFDELLVDKQEDDQNLMYDYVTKCRIIFDYIKGGTNSLNSQLCFNRIENFDKLREIVKAKSGSVVTEERADEIEEYLKLKEQVLRNAKLGTRKSFVDREVYDSSEDVKKLMKFVVKASTRKETPEELAKKQKLNEKTLEEVDEEFIARNYDKLVDSIIDKNRGAVTLYNEYMAPANIDIIPLEEEKTNDNKENPEEDFWEK